jgi:hypothetical protein
MLMVVYGALAIAADSGPTYLLCAAMRPVEGPGGYGNRIARTSRGSAL